MVAAFGLVNFRNTYMTPKLKYVAWNVLFFFKCDLRANILIEMQF